MNVRTESRTRGIKFLIGGIFGATLLVMIFSAAVGDWSYITRWGSGLAAVALVIGYKVAKHWLIGRAIHVEREDENEQNRQSPDA